ncbi:potassium-transporting ATPase subunit C [Chryseobacterium arachidis]|uniref:potassium-transporting ATPase subunit C n=1 Tax=Chryseobacterium arachidis TaxID=1416778 RepID=UPI003612257E
MRQNILPAIRLTLICAVFFSGIYTLLIFGIAQAAPNNGKGEIITRKESSVKNENEFKPFTIIPISVRNSIKMNISGQDHQR